MSSGATAMFPSAHTAGRAACGAFPVLSCAIEDSRERGLFARVRSTAGLGSHAPGVRSDETGR